MTVTSSRMETPPASWTAYQTKTVYLVRAAGAEVRLEMALDALERRDEWSIDDAIKQIRSGLEAVRISPRDALKRMSMEVPK